MFEVIIVLNTWDGPRRVWFPYIRKDSDLFVILTSEGGCCHVLAWELLIADKFAKIVLTLGPMIINFTITA